MSPRRSRRHGDETAEQPALEPAPARALELLSSRLDVRARSAQSPSASMSLGKPRRLGARVPPGGAGTLVTEGCA